MNRTTVKNISIAVIVIALLAGGFYYFSYYRSGSSSQYDHYYSSFTKISGLQESGPVLLHGVKIGKIKSIELGEDRNLHVTYSIKKGIKIPSGTIAKVVNGDVSGTKGVKFFLGKQGSYLPVGSHIPTIPDTSLIELFNAKITPAIRGSKFLLRTADSTLYDINYLIRYGGLGNKAQDQIKFFQKDFKGFANTSRDVSRQVESLSQTIERLHNSVSDPGKMNANINGKIGSGINTMKGLSDKDYDSLLKSAAASVTRIMDNVVKISKTNKLFNDKADYTKANAQLDSANASMQELMTDPPGIQLIGGGKKKK